MRRSFLLTIVFLLLYFSAFTEVGAQSTAVSCRRSIIESYPEDEKRPVLQYLDEARQLADELVRLLAEGRYDEIYNLNKDVSILVQGVPVIKMDLATFEQKQGKIIDYEYRNQDVVYHVTRPEINLRGRVGTWYAVKTTRTESGFVSLLVDTRKARDDNRLILEALFFREWGQSPVPAWLGDTNPPIERGTCPRMEGSLRVKAP